MAFGKVTEEDNGTQSGFVKSNGVHLVELVRVGLTTRANGSKGLVLTVKNPDSEFADTLYSFGDTNYAATYSKADGSLAKMCPRYVNSLAAIVGAEDDATEIQTIDGKDGPVEVEVFRELSNTGTMVNVAVQMQYNTYYKEMKPTVVAVFNEECLSATELGKGITEPKQIHLFDDIQDKLPAGAAAKPAEVSVSSKEEAEDIFG